jgi:hypothetical protein
MRLLSRLFLISEKRSDAFFLDEAAQGLSTREESPQFAPDAQGVTDSQLTGTSTEAFISKACGM